MRPGCGTHQGGGGKGAALQGAETTGLEAPPCVSSGLVARSGVAWIAVAIVLLAGCARPRPAILPPVPARIGYEETGLASWYGNPFHGRRTASGEVYDMGEIDRKSTRLNSSHLVISYAVFCLTKKKTE